MSKIPFCFEISPSYFRKNGWFKPTPNGSHFKTIAFITWCFSRCQAIRHKIFHDNREIELEPFEFVFGRRTCALETGLTDKEIRGQQKRLMETGFLQKRASKKANKYSIYIWITESFTEKKGQQEGQQRASKGPARGPQTRTEEQQNKENVMSRTNALMLTVNKKNSHGKEFTASLEELFSYSIRLKKNWETSEIEEAWKILCSYDAPISDWKAFIEGTIEKKRNFKSKENICKKINSAPKNSKSKQEKDNDFYSERDTSGSPLAIFARQNGLK